MNKLTQLHTIKELQKKYKLHSQKKFGQNFILSTDVIEDIIAAADIGPDDVVVEIGPGMGTLTQALAQEAGQVLAIEIDPRLKRVLAETVTEDNVSFLFEDVLKIDLDQAVQDCFGKKTYKVVANLPYYITTPIIMKLLEEEAQIDSIVVMTQKEVAERINSLPGPKTYGALTVSVEYYSESTLVREVARELFYPVPNVDSAVIKLDIRKEPPVFLKDKDLFFQVVKASFMHRRKTLLNALSHHLSFVGKDQLKETLEMLKVNPKRRGETLDIQEFAAISNELFSMNKND